MKLHLVLIGPLLASLYSFTTWRLFPYTVFGVCVWGGAIFEFCLN